ncbi:unnamed protein product [Brachionus calyciflorus]|uniref:Uncharacterized protein n=1 Tax=Brachionus calyciflorus TaxID=104777 RepID=A0A814CT48_9BILA|nr:unnamed protein product [Brachionus calyciflorus]
MSESQCRHFFINQNYNPDTNVSKQDFYSSFIPNDVKHGDMLVCGEKDLRSMNIFYYDSSTKKLVQKDPSGSGYTCVPLEITKSITNPIEFYQDAFKFNGYDEIDFLGIELDAQVHQDLVKEFTNGRQVSFDKTLFYFLTDNEWESEAGLFVYDDDSGRYIKLTPSIDQKYL